MNRIVLYAKKTFKALQKNTVVQVYDVLEQLSSKDDIYYLGVKNTSVITDNMIQDLKHIGYVQHTLDKASEKGRAIDITLQNPITGNWMSGSSSGSALNVFYEINDIAIATDGGGSVLAPALALNCYGFISPLFYQEEVKKFSKKSTDGIEFTPSIGFISKSFTHLEKITNYYFKDTVMSLKLVVAQTVNKFQNELITKLDNFSYDTIQLEYTQNRSSMIKQLQNFDFENQILCTFEGPVDVFGYGDSIIGHYGNDFKKFQNSGNKYFLTVANMLNLSAIVIPSEQLGCGILLMCKSNDTHIQSMLKIAQKIEFKRSTLEQNYFIGGE